MRYGRYGWSYVVLRGGLGLVFLWIGIDILRHPSAWLGFVPRNVPLGLTREAALDVTGVFDAALGLLFITGSFPRLSALLAALHLAGILVTQGFDAVIIRDVGLLGTALALLIWPQHHHRRHWWMRLWRRQPPTDS